MACGMNDPLVQFPGYVLRRASSAVMARLHDHLAPLDLRATEASLILLMGTQGGITQSEAGRILGIKRANMVPMTAKLVARGLISRSQMNGRSQGLELTASGRDMLEAAHKAIATHEAETMSGIPEALRPHVVPILIAMWRQTHEGE